MHETDGCSFFCSLLPLCRRHNEMHTKDRYIGLIESAAGGTGIQQWATNGTDQTCGQEASRLSSHYAPASLYSSMVQPYLPYTVRAAIWYQGEANADECCPINR
eukprot:m.257978 g.257978  ORF g.257978 m.257978 type:complete len:104 (+) comp40412_c0_seq1:574-885(+)